jgi:hypothetical protein
MPSGAANAFHRLERPREVAAAIRQLRPRDDCGRKVRTRSVCPQPLAADLIEARVTPAFEVRAELDHFFPPSLRGDRIREHIRGVISGNLAHDLRAAAQKWDETQLICAASGG